MLDVSSTRGVETTEDNTQDNTFAFILYYLIFNSSPTYEGVRREVIGMAFRARGGRRKEAQISMSSAEVQMKSTLSYSYALFVQALTFRFPAEIYTTTCIHKYIGTSGHHRQYVRTHIAA